MVIYRDTVPFRGTVDIRALPDIRRGLLYPYTVISQYDNSPILHALLGGVERTIDPFVDIQKFFYTVFNPHTASGWGLDCWGRIVGIGRQLTLRGSDTAFGFHGSDLQPFDQGTFWNDNATSTYTLADEAFRQLIFYKAGINLTDGTLASLNRIMQTMFSSRGKVCVLHIGTMRIRFFFDFWLRPFERALVSREDVPPKPAGVGFDIYDTPRAETFGFAGSDLQPFNRGIFAPRGPQDAYSI